MERKLWGIISELKRGKKGRKENGVSEEVKKKKNEIERGN
jgi:hypothetical protein